MFATHCRTAVLALIASAGFVLSSAVPAQQPEASPFPAVPADAGGKEADKPNALSPEQLADVEEWIESLGSSEFAARELAAARLTDVGKPILPKLRRVAKESNDPEVRLRADEIIKQLTQGDMETRIADFLAGEDVDLAGWQIVRAILGDSGGVRELFVELMKSHPDVTTSLDGTSRDRAMAMDVAVTKVQTRMFKEMRFPTRADAFALLLPPVDPNVPLNATFENLVLSVLQKEAASQIRRDAQLSGPFRLLLSRWIARSTLSSRDDVLLFGMSWGVEATLPLALRTLGEANQTETLAISMQAIARFGTRDHAEFVVPLLDDHRPSSERGFTRGAETRTQLGDVAMATIAILYNMPLKDLGFAEADTHPTYGFILTDIGFPAGDGEPRKAAREKIEELIKKKTPEAEGS